MEMSIKKVGSISFPSGCRPNKAVRSYQVIVFMPDLNTKALMEKDQKHEAAAKS